MTKLERELKAWQRVLLVGPPGIGKTGRMHAAAKACGMELVTMRASLSERIDFGGCLIPDRQAGVTRTLPLELLHKLKQSKKPTCLFIDDMGQAPMDVQAAIMKLFDPGELPDNVLITGATNRPGDKAGVTAMCEPLRSRFDSAYSIPTPGCEASPKGGTLLHDWKTELEGWIGWAQSNKAAPEIIAYHMTTGGKDLYSWTPQADPSVRMPDYRTWGTMIKRWTHGLRDLDDVSATIGKPVALSFLAFARIRGQLPMPDQVWTDPMHAPLPIEPSAYWLVACVLGEAVGRTTAPAFIQYIERMPRIYTAFASLYAYKRIGTDLSGCKEWTKWFRENKELFETAT